MVEGVVWRVVPRVVVVRERGRGRGRRRHGRGDRCPGDEDAGEACSRDVARAVLLSFFEAQCTGSVVLQRSTTS
jgi:hypothetical protein